MFCAKCGTALDRGERFCRNCGAEAPMVSNAHQQAQPEAGDVIGGDGVDTKKKVCGALKRGVLVAVFLVALVTVAVGVVFCMRGRNVKRNLESSVIESIRHANGGVSPALAYTSSGMIRSIQGTFTERVVRSEVDARDSIRDIQPLLDIDDIDNDITFVGSEESNDGKTVWWFAYVMSNDDVSSDKDDIHGIGVITNKDGLTQGLTAQSVPVELMSQVDHVESAYAAKIMDYVETYGYPTVRTNGHYAFAEGVCLAQLIDFDADGSDELLVAYFDDRDAGEKGINDARVYRVEVWSCHDGEIVLSHSQNAMWTNGGFGYLNMWQSGNGTSWIEELSYESTSRFERLYGMVDGSFQMIHVAEYRDEFTNPTLRLNGAEVELRGGAWEATYASNETSFLFMGDSTEKVNKEDHDEPNGYGSYSQTTYSPDGCIDLTLTIIKRICGDDISKLSSI